jgi:hypothetical protein
VRGTVRTVDVAWIKLSFYSLRMSRSLECEETLRVLERIKDAADAECARACRVAELYDSRYEYMQHVMPAGCKPLVDACTLADDALKKAQIARERANVASAFFDHHRCHDA